VPCPEGAPKDQAIPQTNPFAGLDEPIWNNSNAKDTLSKEDRENASFLSPLYDRLETNIPRGLMGFSDLPWPESAQLFPKHAQVQNYIEDYSADVRHLISFQTQVIDLHQNHPSGSWTLKTKPITRSTTTNSEIQTHTFDAIVLANGHFNIPYIPSVPGLSAWSTAHPNTITHSKFYRLPEAYTSRKVIIVGNSASGLDIASQIAPFSKHPLLISSRSESYLQSGETPSNQLDKPPISKFILDGNRTVEFEDGSRESGVDAVVYCTGYFYSFPFVSDLSPNPPLTTTGERVENLYKHLFYRPNPTLALPVLNQKVIPFPFAEAQAAVIARVFSGRLELPSQKEMEEWERREVEEKGDGRGFHVLKFPKDAEFINEMHDWALSAEGEDEGEGGVGKKPPYWGEKEFWTRERFPAIKKAFQGFGEGRHEIRTLGEVGFDFEAWKEGKDREDKGLL
jgi:cation diffusion facilitator CzcD-associated flavoprotein CzcO